MGREEVGVAVTEVLALKAASPARGATVLEFRANERQDELAVLLDVRDAFVATNRDDVGPGVDVVQDGGGHGLVAADECGGGTRCVRRARRRRPQRPVIVLGRGGEAERALGALVLRGGGAEYAGEALRSGGAVLETADQDSEYLVGLLPGLRIGFRDNRAEGDPDVLVRPAGPVGDGIDAVDLRAYLGQRLAPEGEPVGLGPADTEGSVGLPPDGDRDRLAGVGPEARSEVVELVELAGVAERFGLGPGPAEQVNELRRAGVAAGLGLVVAVLALLGQIGRASCRERVFVGV